MRRNVSVYVVMSHPSGRENRPRRQAVHIGSSFTEAEAWCLRRRPRASTRFEIFDQPLDAGAALIFDLPLRCYEGGRGASMQEVPLLLHPDRQHP